MSLSSIYHSLESAKRSYNAAVQDGVVAGLAWTAKTNPKFAIFSALILLGLAFGLGLAFKEGLYSIQHIQGITGAAAGVTALFLLGRYIYVYRRDKAEKGGEKWPTPTWVKVGGCILALFAVGFFSYLCVYYYSSLLQGGRFALLHAKEIGAGMAAAWGSYLFLHVIKESVKSYIASYRASKEVLYDFDVMHQEPENPGDMH